MLNIIYCFSSLLSYDTTLRCNFVDLYYTLFGRQKILRAEVAALYKPIKVEVEVKFYFINKKLLTMFKI